MGDDHSSGGSGDTPESLAAEREEMEEAVAGLRQMERDFDTLTKQEKLFDPDRVALCIKLKGPEMKRCVWKGFTTPEGFQWHQPAMAMEKALAEQLHQDLAAYCEALALWAEELEQRESKPNRPDAPALGFLAGPGLSGEISAPGVGEAAADAEATGSILTGASLLPAAAAAIVVTGAAAVGYGAYKADVEPGLQAWAETSNDMRAQLDQENYVEDHGPEYENTPQKGRILYDGEYVGQDGNIYTRLGVIAVYANGTSALSSEERQAIANGNEAVPGVPNSNPFIYGLTPQPGKRGTAISRAKALEVKLVRATGAGTLDWTRAEIEYIEKTGELPDGIVGHHINNVSQYPDWAGDPRNIQFLRGQSQNLQAHGGNFQTSTAGPLIDRAAMIQKATGAN